MRMTFRRPLGCPIVGKSVYFSLNSELLALNVFSSRLSRVTVGRQGSRPLPRAGRLLAAFLLVLFCTVIARAQVAWEPEARLTHDPMRSDSPSLCCDMNNWLHLAWWDARDGNAEVYTKRSTDGGTTWGADRRLTFDGADSFGSSIHADDVYGYLHLVFYDNRSGNLEIYYKRSTDGGASWQDDVRLTQALKNSLFHSRCLVADSAGQLHLLWDDKRFGNFEVYYKRSTDGGDTWQADLRMTEDPGLSYGSSLCLDSSGRLHAVWFDDRDGNCEIYTKRSTDGGTTWGSDTRLTFDPAGSKTFGASVCADPSEGIHVVWKDNRDGDDRLYYKRSTDGGASFADEINLTPDPAPSYYLVFPFIDCDSLGRIHVVWSQLRDHRAGTELYYRRSTDRGATWEVEQRLTFDPAYTNYPFLDVDVSGAVHLVFEDWRCGGGESEILYKRGFQSGQPQPDIKLNGDDGPLSVSHTEKSLMTISLDAGALAGVEHDWWVFAQLDSTSLFWLQYPHLWTQSAVPLRVYAGPLRKLNNLTIAEGKIPVGSWTFTFGVDQRNDYYEVIFFDSVVVDSN